MTSSLYSEKDICLEDALKHNLSEEEYQEICTILKRPPTLTELGIYSGLWSEHCSYKNSIRLLKTFPLLSKRSLAIAGEENAGVLDIGDGLAVVFKIESHNHPTAIEPYQGAATGVGGIMRDIFTMGARPLCSLNLLRFGPLQKSRNRYLLWRAVQGIGDYGNSLGIPVMGGELFFDPSFTRNCLVNAMTVGIAKHKELAFAKATGVANPVFIVGAASGRDGLHGASFASQDLSEASEARRSAVQVGDPFTEKLLMEATLELLSTDVVVGIQDMGAAGLSCCSAEMSAKGKCGMFLDLDKVPLRERDMSAYEIMLSESQERMLVVAKAGSERKVKEIFAKWELTATVIGKVTDDSLLTVCKDGRLCAQIPVQSLVLGGGAPQYEREMQKPDYLERLRALPVNPCLKSNTEEGIEKTESKAKYLEADLLMLLGSPNLCSRQALYEQYDSEVGLARVIGPGGDGGVARILGSSKGIAVATDCNSRYVYLHPFNGAAQAVCESARNVAVSGAEPIGITNCLNFANPYKPENYYLFSECVRGIKTACETLDIPVTGGNVSFYNESEEGPILPTPAIGMVGLIEDLDYVVRPHLPAADLLLALVGFFQPSMGGSEYLYCKRALIAGEPPSLDLDQEKKLIRFLVIAARQKMLCSARDLSLGGLAIALFRSACNETAGRVRSFQLEQKLLRRLMQENNISEDELLFFGETNGSALVSLKEEDQELLQGLAVRENIPFKVIGRSGPCTKYNSEKRLNFGLFQVTIKNAIFPYKSGLNS